MKFIQRLTGYKIGQGIRDDPFVKKLFEVFGDDEKAEADLKKLVWKAFEDPNCHKLTIRRDSVPEDSI